MQKPITYINTQTKNIKKCKLLNTNIQIYKVTCNPSQIPSPQPLCNIVIPHPNQYIYNIKINKQNAFLSIQYNNKNIPNAQNLHC